MINLSLFLVLLFSFLFLSYADHLSLILDEYDWQLDYRCCCVTDRSQRDHAAGYSKPGRSGFPTRERWCSELHPVPQWHFRSVVKVQHVYSDWVLWLCFDFIKAFCCLLNRWSVHGQLGGCDSGRWLHCIYSVSYSRYWSIIRFREQYWDVVLKRVCF